MIHLENITISKNEKILLNNINVVLKEKVSIVGPHGSGKTELLKALCGRMKINTGKILLSDKFILENNLIKSNNIFMYIPKDYPNFYKDLKVRHILAFFAKNTQHSLLMKDGEIDLNSRFKDLSFIQKLILFIDIGKKNDKKIFMFDEPFLHLDMLEIIVFKKIYKEYLDDKAIILTSCNTFHTMLNFNQNLYIHNKELIEDNPFSTILSS